MSHLLLLARYFPSQTSLQLMVTMWPSSGQRYVKGNLTSGKDFPLDKNKALFCPSLSFLFGPWSVWCLEPWKPSCHHEVPHPRMWAPHTADDQTGWEKPGFFTALLGFRTDPGTAYLQPLTKKSSYYLYGSNHCRPGFLLWEPRASLSGEGYS